MKFNQFLFLNEILESSSSNDKVANFIVSYIKEEKPKIKNFVDIINKYLDKEISKFKRRKIIIGQYNDQKRKYCFKFFNRKYICNVVRFALFSYRQSCINNYK